MPTAIRNILDHPECAPDIPSTTLAIPLNRSAMPIKKMTTNAVATGKAIARLANIRTSMPSPIVARMCLEGRKIPVIIFSSPTNNNTTATNIMTEMKVKAGNARAIIDNMIVRIPSPICAPLTQPGDFACDKDLPQ